MGRILLLSMMLAAWSFQAQEPSDNCPVVENTVQIFCETQGEGNFFYRPAVKHLEASANGEEIVWFDTETSEEPLSNEEFLVNEGTYFAGNASGSCQERIEVIVTLGDSPNAGGTTFYEVANTAEPFDILDIYEPSILGAPEAGGTVLPPLTSGTTMFDPSVDGSGQYRYTVATTNDICEDDSSYIYITVVPDPQEPSGDPTENCAVVDEAVQVFCESQGEGNDFYRPAVAHLLASANGDAIEWFDTPTSTEALSMDEILVDGEDYYAANASGNCTTRVRVDCVVNDSPNAGATTFVTFCSEAGPVNLLDYFNSSIIGGPDPGGEIFPPLASGTTIFDPRQDAPGQYVYKVPANEFCGEDRAVMYVSISEGSGAGDDITLNLNDSGAPVNLFTELGIPAGASASVTPSLSSGTGEFDPSVDAAGIYTVTVDNGEGCEADSALVTVNITRQDDPVQNCPTVANTSQVFCESQGEGNDFYRPAVAHLEATANGDAVVWFDTELSGEPLSPEDILVDGEDYYAGNASNTCGERVRVDVTVNPSPNAGGTTLLTVSSSDAAFDILDILGPSMIGDAEPGGTINPPLASGTTIFDPAVDVGGQYVYTVPSNGLCPSDSAVCYITVEEDPEAAAVNSNASQAVVLFPNPSQGNMNLSMGEGISVSAVRIFDLSGNVVKAMELNSDVEVQNFDISSLTPSIYFAEIQTDKGNFVKRIVKN